jgi:hypothetical protein
MITRSASKPKSRFGAIVGFACALLVLLALVVVSWFRPLPKPQLVLISSDLSNSPLLPPTPFVGNDANALYGLNTILNVRDTDPDSLSYREMQAVVDDLPDTPLLPTWFPWQKRTTLVYVNAAGLAIPPAPGAEPTAYLLPDDFGITLGTIGFPTNRAVAVTELLDKLVHHDADYKLLILDCQRFDHFWPLGILSNTFVDSVRRELREHEDRYRGIIVIFSCSPSELTWAEGGYYHSTFAYYFIRGMTGPADTVSGNKDGRVSVKELFDYVRFNIERWMAANRTEAQVPLMECVGLDPADVELVALPPNQSVYEGSTPIVEMNSPHREQNLATLEADWKQYYDLARQTPHPAVFRPHLWRGLEDTLLRAERYFRGANMVAMSEELRKVNYRLQALETPRLPVAEGTVAYSRPMAELFGSAEPTGLLPDTSPGPSSDQKSTSEPVASTDTVAPHADGTPGSAAKSDAHASDDSESNKPASTAAKLTEKPPSVPSSETDVTSPINATAPKSMSSSTVWKLIDDVVRGREAVDVAARQLQQASSELHALPVEAEMLRMMAEFGPLSQGDADEGEISTTAQRLVAQRVLAERAAAPAEYLAPRVFPWVHDLVDRGDQYRRLDEDAFFARGTSTVSIRLARQDAPESAPGLYQRALQTADKLAQAFTVRDRTLAEAVHLVTLCGMRHGNTEANNFRETVDRLTLSLFSNLDELDCKLRSGAVDADDRSRTEQLLEISALTEQVTKLRSQILLAVGNEARALSRGQQEQRAGSDEVWRRAATVLTLPFAYSDEPSATLAARRIYLLKRLCQQVIPDSDQHFILRASDDRTVHQREEQLSEQIKYSRKLAAAFYGLPDSINTKELETEREAAAFSPAIARGWLQTYEAATLATFPQQKLGRLLQASTACRIMESYPIAVGVPSNYDLATRLLCRRELAALCAWQGSRLAEDFWAGKPNAEDYYFHRTAQHYFDVAKSLDPDLCSGEVILGNRLEELYDVAGNISQRRADDLILSRPSRIVFRGVDSLEFGLGVQLPEDTPSGIASVTCEARDGDVTIRPLPAATADTELSYTIQRPPAQRVDTRLATTLYYRGHTCSRRLNVRGPADDDGPTVVIQDRREGDATITIRPAEISAAPASVLFVLDCSRSMLEGARMDTLRSTLRQLGQVVAPGSINVGVRTLGDRVVWRQGNTAEEDAARKDTRLELPIRPFSQRRFDQAVDHLHAVGESPIIYALLEAQQDFRELGDNSEKIIILISDGSDNWAAVGEKPGLDQFDAEYSKNDIAVNTVGFQTDMAGYYQLQQIAASTGGKCVRADNGRDLLDNILGLAGVRTYTVSASSEIPTPQTPYRGIVSYEPQPMQIPPGVYDVDVEGYGDRIVASRRQINIQRGDRYELFYGGGKLSYAPTSYASDLATATDKQSGAELRILRAELQDDDLVIEFSLSNIHNANWFPADVSLHVQGRGADTAYAARDISPNVPKQHSAVWQVRLSNWPRHEYLADIALSWSDVGDPRQTVYSVDWGAPLAAGTLPADIQLARRTFKTELLMGTPQQVASVALVFPEGYQGVQQWSVQLPQRVVRSRQTYNVLDAMYSADFVLPDDERPQKLLVRGPHGQRPVLKTAIDLRARRIN